MLPLQKRNGDYMTLEQIKTFREKEIEYCLNDPVYFVEEYGHIEDKDAQNVIFIPVTDVKATDFNLSEHQKQELITLGEDKTKKFLGRWTY